MRLSICGFLLLLLSSPSLSDDLERAYTAMLNQDYATALSEAKPLAESGNPDAQFLLGTIYRYALGVTEDYETAMEWYVRASEKGVATAQQQLGSMYWNGQGVLRDSVYAHMWFNISASLGNEKAATSLTNIATVMTPADISKAQQLARECVAKNYKGC